MPSDPRPNELAVTRDHRRQWRECVYVYPVISRRARGVSVGVNLNIDKRCSYACVYCQINRKLKRPPCPVDPARLREELLLALGAVQSGELWAEERFSQTPDALRRINDIAFSGDGEPTRCEMFGPAVDAAVNVRRELGLDDLKLIVITNGAHLQDAPVVDALETLSKNNGEIWAKLDAGTPAYHRTINRPIGDITLDAVCENIRAAAAHVPVVIQSLFLRLDGAAPSDAEIAAYIDRLKFILAGEGNVRLIQLHTVARPPAESAVSYLPDDQLDAIAAAVRTAIPAVPVEVTYGSDVAPQQ
jgi:wyosine [tRNA(Phe)-imidazoG37] synthetase (radical SAM superfamily)